MGEDMTNVYPPPVVVNCGNDSNFVSSDIENGQFAHLVGARKCLP